MRIVKNTVLSLAVILGSISFANAQMMRAGVQITPSLPLGDFADIAEFGFGGGVFADFYPNQNFHVGVDLGYKMYSVAFEGVDESYTMLPLQATAAYHTDAEGRLDFYFGTGLGVFLFSNTGEGAETESYFGITPRAGVSYALTDILHLNGGLAFGYVLTPDQEMAGITVEQPDITFLDINIGISIMLFD